MGVQVGTMDVHVGGRVLVNVAITRILVGVRVLVSVHVLVNVHVFVGDGVLVGVAVSDGVHVEVAAGVGVLVLVAVGVGLLVRVEVPDGVFVGRVGSSVNVNVAACAAVAENVGVSLWPAPVASGTAFAVGSCATPITGVLVVSRTTCRDMIGGVLSSITLIVPSSGLTWRSRNRPQGL